MTRQTLRCGRSQHTLPGMGPSSYLDRPSQVHVPLSADIVNSHPTSSLAIHICIHPAERQRERPRGQKDTPGASQVINHRIISRAPIGPQLPKTAWSPIDRSRADILTRENLKRKLEQQVRQSCSHCRDCFPIPAELVFAAGSLFSRDNG